MVVPCGNLFLYGIERKIKMTEKFEKGTIVWVWNSNPSEALVQKFCADMRVPGCEMEFPYRTYDVKNRTHEWRNCSKIKPAVAPAEGTRIIGIDIEAGIDYRLYSAGRFDEDGELLCYVDGTDKWTSCGRMRAWLMWTEADPDSQ